VALLREEDGFAAAIGQAAERLGGLDAAFVEKDYWVTQVLRALHTEYPHGFVFKGGTSLSKGYGIIERFSEDVDILVVPLAGASITEAENHLAAITGSVAGFLGLDWEPGREPGRGRDAHRGDLIHYQPVIEAGLRLGIRPGAVLLETGYSGGREPTEMVDITPILCEPLGINPADFEDTQLFQLRALEPRRTLVEKLFALHHLATLWLEGDIRDEERFGRHYYDIYKLLDHQPTITKLERDRDGFEQLVAEVERLSQRQFGGTTPRPRDGFAASPAFSPGRDGDLRAWLEGKFRDALALFPGAAAPPNFGRILQRIEQRAGLL
jgi:hypothetical protein